ncbi:helix-turn-helix transcriptional regulator [Marinifilum fragile]|uniref:helix-turn-helix domain-containing protein n=1 Tax=Marinifilum fragile TaxID=570161 RepID=UPI002AA60926|nr:helix-turn-helix transcriptional regulator [Marinifilum fragile]
MIEKSIISSNIKDIRINKKLSQEDLSEKSGLSLRTVQRLENGESVPRGDTLRRLADALKLPDNYFNESSFKNNSNVKNKKSLTIPWFLIGLFAICGSTGFILSLILANLNIIPHNELSLPFITAITILFSGVGIFWGNLIEKKHRK